MPTWFPLVASIVLAILPVFVWINFLQKEGEQKGLYIKTFLFGTLTVIPPFIVNEIIFTKWPAIDLYSLVGRTVEQVALAALLTNVFVGILEEIAKNVIVRVIDKRHPEYIQTITSALKLSICAGLGFAFAENIFYFYGVWVSPEYGKIDLFTTFIFRSIFTMLGHMVFSGIFGYYFGVGKFSADITEHARWEGRGLYLATWISKLTGKMTFQVVRELENAKGLFMAMMLHASFNASLDLEHKLPSILIVGVSAVYILYLLQTKSGHLLFTVAKRKASSMAAADQDVVMELLGMWTKEGRLREVMEICDRLLARDPDNNVVKLFRAKAADSQELRNFYKSLKAVFEKEITVNSEHGAAAVEGSSLNVQDEKVVIELMDKWYKEGKYKEVLDISNRLLARNPQSQGAKVLLDKAIDREKLQHMFDSLTRLFKE